MPRPSRRKGRRGRNNKKANNSKRTNEKERNEEKEEEEVEDDDNNHEEEQSANTEIISISRDDNPDQPAPIIEKIGKESVEKVNVTDFCGEEDVISGETRSEARMNDGQVIKITTEVSEAPRERSEFFKNANESRRAKFRVENRRVIKPETRIVEITSLRGSSQPLAASIDFVPGVGIIETGKEETRGDGTIVTISEPPEPLEPLPNALADKLKNLKLASRKRDNLARLASEDSFNSSIDEESMNEGPEIRELASESDLETEISNGQRVTRAIVLEVESDVERDVDQSREATIAEETEETDEESLLQSKNYTDLDKLTIPDYVEGQSIINEKENFEDLGCPGEKKDQVMEEPDKLSENVEDLSRDMTINEEINSIPSDECNDPEELSKLDDQLEDTKISHLGYPEQKQKDQDMEDYNQANEQFEELSRDTTINEEINSLPSDEYNGPEELSKVDNKAEDIISDIRYSEGKLKDEVTEECNKVSESVEELSRNVTLAQEINSIPPNEYNEPEELLKMEDPVEIITSDFDYSGEKLKDDVTEECNKVSENVEELSRDMAIAQEINSIPSNEYNELEDSSKIHNKLKDTISTNDCKGECPPDQPEKEKSCKRVQFDESSLTTIKNELDKGIDQTVNQISKDEPSHLSDNSGSVKISEVIKQSSSSSKISSVSKEVEHKLRLFIETLARPTCSKNESISRIDRSSFDTDEERRLKKRILDSNYVAEAKYADRYLDIIQEEQTDNKLSENNERHIRDFINEEISKYRRKTEETSNCKTTTMNNPPSETPRTFNINNPIDPTRVPEVSPPAIPPRRTIKQKPNQDQNSPKRPPLPTDNDLINVESSTRSLESVQDRIEIINKSLKFEKCSRMNRVLDEQVPPAPPPLPRTYSKSNSSDRRRYDPRNFSHSEGHSSENVNNNYRGNELTSDEWTRSRPSLARIGANEYPNEDCKFRNVRALVDVGNISGSDACIEIAPSSNRRAYDETVAKFGPTLMLSSDIMNAPNFVHSAGQRRPGEEESLSGNVAEFDTNDRQIPIGSIINSTITKNGDKSINNSAVSSSIIEIKQSKDSESSDTSIIDENSSNIFEKAANKSEQRTVLKFAEEEIRRVENNQHEYESERRSEGRASSISPGCSSLRLFGSRSDEACLSQGQTNSVTTPPEQPENKNWGIGRYVEYCAPARPIVTETPERKTILVRASCSPAPEEDRESSSSGAATPNTVRLNPATSLANLASLELFGSIEESTVNYESTEDQNGHETLIHAGETEIRSLDKEENSFAFGKFHPEPLKYLCTKRIISLPYGLQIIKEIIIPRSREILKNKIDPRTEDSMPTEKMRSCKTNSWMGVPTMEDPNLLVCLSPSQQQSKIHTSADNLLDLHKKFLNRRSYHDHDRSVEIEVPKYRIDLGTRLKDSDEFPKDRQEFRESSASRLLEIIKENPIGSSEKNIHFAEDSKNNQKDPGPAKVHFENGGLDRDRDRPIDRQNLNEDRLKATKLSDWLNLARINSQESTIDHHEEPPISSKSEPFKIGPNKMSLESPECRKDSPSFYGNEINSTNVESFYEKMYDRVISEMEITKLENLIRDETSPRSRVPGYERCPTISAKSAIIDKTMRDEEPSRMRKATPMSRYRNGGTEPRHINPALIEAKSSSHPEQGAPNSKIAQPSTTLPDKSCIDTTSIFDKSPPSSRLAPRKYHHDHLKQSTAANIVSNLKTLEKINSSDQRKFSLPQVYFEQQLKYIEQLENQLRDVILAEEDEKKAYEDFKGLDQEFFSEGHNVPSSHPQNETNFENPIKEEFKLAPEDSSNPNDEQMECWHEESTTTEGNRHESSKREGKRQSSKSVTHHGNVRLESSNRHYENIDEKHFSTTEISNGFSSGSSPEGFNVLLGKHNPFNEKGPDGAHLKDPMFTASAPNGQVFRQRMFDEYVHKVNEREERKQHKVIKLSSSADINRNFPKSPTNESNMSSVEREFIERARNRLSKFGINLDDSESEVKSNDKETETSEKNEPDCSSVELESKVKENCQSAKCLIDGREIVDAKTLPKHLQEFLELTASNFDDGFDSGTRVRGKTNATDLLHEIDTALKIGKGFLLGEGVWSPGSEPPRREKEPSPDRQKKSEKDAGIPPVWTPSSAGPSPVAERKEFRPVPFESPVLSRKQITPQKTEALPPWNKEEDEEGTVKREAASTVTHNITTRIVNSHSAPSQGLNTLAGTPRLPRAQNPTITLLQKAREGQLPKGAAYLEQESESKSNYKTESSSRYEPAEYIYTVKREYESEPETTQDRPKKMADLRPRKIEGIGPTTKDGIPVALRSEVKNDNQAKWYKKMYDSLHRADKDDDYITVRYKPRRGGRYGYGSSSGYLSEPEPRGTSERSATLDNRRRQRNKENDFSTSTMPRKTCTPLTQPEVYRTQPGRIENYEPGRSSIAERETKEWWDEVMDIFDGWLTENEELTMRECRRIDRQKDNQKDEGKSKLDRKERASKLLSLSYRPDSSSVSLLSPLATSRPAAAINPENLSSKRPVQRFRESISADRSKEDKEIGVDRSSAGLPNAAKILRKSPPESLALDRPREIAMLIEKSRKSIASLANRRLMNSLSRDPNQKLLMTKEKPRPEDDRIIRPLEVSQPPLSRTIILEGKSKSFVLPDHRERIGKRLLAAPSASQTNISSIERRDKPFPLLSRNDDDQPHRHHHHHDHHHHRHQTRQRLNVNSTGTRCSNSSSSCSASSSSSSSSCTFSTNDNFAPQSPSANNGVTKNPQYVASCSRTFDQRGSQLTKPYMSHALKESGYESDSTLIFRRRDEASPLSPVEQKIAYRTIQKGGDVPLHGLRKPAPERPKDDTEIEYFPISPTLTRIRVRRRGTAITRSENSMTFARYKRTAPSATSSSTLPIRRSGSRSTIGRATSSGKATSPPPGRPPTRVASPRCHSPPSPPRRSVSRHNATLRSLFIDHKHVSRSLSCPNNRNHRVSSTNRHEQCFAAESVSNIRFLRERLSNKLSEQIRERESSRKQLSIIRTLSISPSTSASLSTLTRTKICTFGKTIPTESTKRRSEVSVVKKVQDVSSVRKNPPKICTPERKKIAESKIIDKEKPPCIKSRGKSPERREIGPRISTIKTDKVKILKKKELSDSKRNLPTEPKRGLSKPREQTDSGSRVTKSVQIDKSKKTQQSPPGIIKNRSCKKSSSKELISTTNKTSTSPVIKSSPRPGSSPGGPPSVKTKEKKSTSLGPTNPGMKRLREKPATIVKQPCRRNDTSSPVTIKMVPGTRERKSDKISKVGSSILIRERGDSKIIRNDKSGSKLTSSLRETKVERIANGHREVTTTREKTSGMEKQKPGRRATRESDSFFQSLFLRGMSSSSPVPSSADHPTLRSSVIERARMFQQWGESDRFKSEPSLRSLGVYLAHKRPVSNSRFKNSERESLSSRSSSSCALPGRSIHQQVRRFESYLGINDLGSSASSLRGARTGPKESTKDRLKETRSLSEPPPMNLPSSPFFVLSSSSFSSSFSSSEFYYKNKDNNNEIDKRNDDDTKDSSIRARSPSPGRRSAACRRIKSLRERPEVWKSIRTRSASDAEDRKISNFGSNLELTMRRSTGSLDRLSPGALNREDYHRYVIETSLQNGGRRGRKSERYRDLYNFYASLERMGELEKSTSTSELRPRLRDEEIIDYDRWRELRSKERAEEELREIYGKLKLAQREKDLLFTTRDVEKFKWRGDCGLRCKERSVENIREAFRRLEREEESESEATTRRRREIASKRDVYKPLWRGNSVASVANSISKRGNTDTGSDERKDKKVKDEEDERSQLQPALQKRLGGSKKFWSSLSIEQVTTLKNQLNEIYGSELNGKPKSRKTELPVEPSRSVQVSRQMTNDYEIVVPEESQFGETDEEPSRRRNRQLHVRSHSMLETSGSFEATDKRACPPAEVAKRRGSIHGTIRETKKGAAGTLSETEKKRLSQSLSKEILDKVTRKSTSGSSSRTSLPSASTPRACYSLESSFEETSPGTKFREKTLVTQTEFGDYPREKNRVHTDLDATSKITGGSTGSEFDSATESSEASVRTVVGRGNEIVTDLNTDLVPRKVEFFEKIRSPEDTKDGVRFSDDKKERKKSRLSSAQSFADLKELFGEIESARYTTLPAFGKTNAPVNDKREKVGRAPAGRSVSVSVSVSPDVTEERALRRELSCLGRARSVSPRPISESTCSLESARVSPDPERYWRAYLTLAKNGSVRKLRAKFESLEELSSERRTFFPRPKRFQSDPELTRNLLKRASEQRRTDDAQLRDRQANVAFLRRKYENTRGRSRKRIPRSPPIRRIPLRLQDLSMPRINVISKTAELQENKMRSGSTDSLARRAETEELQANKPVARLRDKFEAPFPNDGNTSLLGSMFTSAPNVNELRDIAPYLAGSWIAHKFPNRRDNARSLSLPPEFESCSVDRSKTMDSRLKSRSPRTLCFQNGLSSSDVSASGTSSARPNSSSSVKKQTQADPFADQNFDPSKHRPKFRYQPPPPPPPPPPITVTTLLSRRDETSWLPALPTYTAKPSVTFEEYSNAPPPPPKAHHSRSERPESPRRYVESEVTIHYRSPVRHEAKEILSEEELARRSAENMRRVYQEERRRKYLQELHDIDSRRHTDNFVPSQKSPIALNRYDDFVDDLSYRSRSQEQTPEPRLVARALYNFVGQSSRELTFRRGDLIFVRRQVDKNWYEGEHNAMIGLFPFNYVEILPYDAARSTPKKSYEGQARAKFNFVAHTNLELSLAKGEMIVITRRVDENWYEGRINNRRGIFPVSYVEVLAEPGHRPETPVQSSKPVASPAAHSLLSNGTSGGKLSMGPHHYTPSMPLNMSTTQPHYNSLPRMGGGSKLHVAPVNETLHIDTHSETIPYRALYNYRPQNEDELELREGDTVYVMEKCDDGWYVGSSQRSGYFGTFPGNYVEPL